MLSLGRISTEDFHEALEDDTYAREIIALPTLELHKSVYDHINEVYSKNKDDIGGTSRKFCYFLKG